MVIKKNFGPGLLLYLLQDNSNTFVLHYIRGLRLFIVSCRQMRLQKHIVVILEMGDIVAGASQVDTLLFTENYRLYSGLQLKAVVSHTGLQA